MSKALLVIDVQNDFYEDGALAVPEASKINMEINERMHTGGYEVIVASQDWHPSDHKSFAVNSGKKPFTPYDKEEGLGPLLWPVHCQQGTEGAEFHPQINTDYFNLILRKGTNREIDSYSAFQENDGTDLGLTSYLKGLHVTEVDICGLALDYCVKYTALDAASKFKTNLLRAATRGVGAEPGDIENTINELKNAGVNIVNRQILS